MAVAADDHVDAPVGVKFGRKLTVLFQADVGEQDRHVGLYGPVVVADDADLPRRLFDVDEGADDLLLLCRREDFLREEPDEEDAQAADLHVQIRLEKPRAVHGHVKVGVDDREARALFQEKQVRKAVVHLMVADRRHVRPQVVHQIDRGEPFVFLVNDGSAEHVSGHHVKRIGLLPADLVDISGKPDQAALLMLAAQLRQKVSVHVV